MTARAALGGQRKTATRRAHAGTVRVARKRSARRSSTAGASRRTRRDPGKDGARVPSTPGNSSLDQFLRMMDDPDDWRTIPSTAPHEAPVKLTAEDLELVRRIEASEYGDAVYDPYEPAVDFFTATPAEGPVRQLSEPKRRLQPSRWEAARIRKILKAIRRGDLQIDGKSVKTKEALPSTAPNYDMWAGETNATILARRSRHIEAPRLALPNHRESYNPPPEYLLSEEEKAAWKARSPDARSYNYIPTRYGALRLVPAYGKLVQERFARCMDLVLCPRAIKQKIQMDPDDLLPVLPDPRDLRPFPAARSIDFVGHVRSITSISIDPTGQWLVSADAAGSLRLWDAQTGHCRRTWSLPDETISSVAWNPNRALLMFAVAYGQRLLLIVPSECSGSESTRTTLQEYRQALDRQTGSSSSSLPWNVGGGKGSSVLPTAVQGDDESIMVSIEHPAKIEQVQWHRRGDYFATLSPGAPSGARVIHIHQLSRHLTQCPFNRMPGIARAIAFHPTHPQLVLATSRAVRIYDLTRRSLVKKLTPGANSLSDLALHPTGDHVLTASHDGALAWFDLDYSVRPYRVLSQHHGAALRTVACHATYPLVATGGDDGCIKVIHATVYTDDLTKSPLIVPVKSLCDWPQAGETLATTVTSLVFHPTQPWLFGATSEGSLSLFV